ncbi:NHL repeat family protein [Mycolicibacterium hassiacum DSM 44199]|jgi:sugar lactone lactonase YvrE|uniref:NHL repeat family protein n=1 Tax=Mycolicibacterium hassiacum (strain DSM 44199 / CIP 105218 / JCM 12690 / 3849) TaxID=1122247 RepID=K5BAM4_MYCHD|nr:SMP-30/gluconolactonase/LRE family protein [Mycolicibacterium hassiacum]EKF22495.1 NHL repeat family protein [Mycolicibacterium hassiacum DSM 44199]MBX5487976.1 SMP-30/gluconolactonase/LRE family protein [Mycolicibacterium hassiacum]MDA4084895.1 gluconolaconase [Mycolicibacterium hassiacum DSM 44199]VCT91723.1 Serine/threonine-protein kinase PknD [Mycolicibacterium hassiacum DSM 44199]
MTHSATDAPSHARYSGPTPATAEGWRLERLTAPSRLFGANGLRTGPDGRVYIAQVTGSQISALDLQTGGIEVVSPLGGDIISPDDVAFDSAGNLFATEVMEGRVSVREAGGRTRVLRDDLPCANGITVHHDRLLINECRDGGRLMELDRATGAMRTLLTDLPSPNAMEVGPDGLLYFPLMTANEIWRIDPDQPGEPQRVAAELGVPDAVKFDPQGRIVSTQVASGQVLRIDPRTGEKTVLAQLHPGLDNLTLVGDKIYVSNFTGEITEIGPGGEIRTALPGGLNWPLDLAVGADGELYVADGTYFYRVGGDGSLHTVGMLFTPGYPGFLRGLAPAGDGAFVVSTSGGQIARYRPADGETDYLADGFDQLYGVALGPQGTIVFAELGTGRVHALRNGGTEVLASGLREPVGVAFDPAGPPLVAESGAGRVVRLGSTVETVVDGLVRPQGILVAGDRLYIVDAGAKEVLAVDLNSQARSTIASGLPVGPPPGVQPKPLKGMPPFSGPQGPFAGIARGADGSLYVSADGDGSVLALRPTAGAP